MHIYQAGTNKPNWGRKTNKPNWAAGWGTAHAAHNRAASWDMSEIKAAVRLDFADIESPLS